MLKQSRADFRYRVISEAGDKILLIVDLDLGGRSVTDDIDNVVADICNLEQTTEYDYFLIAYRDSMGRWDEYDPTTNAIRPLSKEGKETIEEHIKSV